MLLDPQILGALAQALLPVLLQQLGRRDGVALGVRAVQVSPLAALDALRTLVDRARVEVEGQLGPDAGHAAHLRNLLGDFMAEPSSADARAARVVELAHETRAMLGGPSSAPDIVTPLPGSPSNVVRFRRGVTNTRAFPHSAICQLRMQMSDGGDAWFIGTGFYVADGLILTAGHNVLHRRYGRATRLVVTPGRQSMLVRPFGSFEVAPAQMHTHPRWNRTASRADFDLAVLAVRTAPPLGRYFPMATEALSASQRLTVCGYAASESDGVDPNEQNLDEDYVRARTANTVTYGLNTTGGTSGSPAYTELEGRPCVVSVHSRTHDEHTNQGCRLTADKLAWIRGLSRSVPDHLEPRSFVDPQILHVLDEPGGEEPLRFDASDPLSSLYALQYGRRDLATELLLGGEA
jgi:V8-like Glu-specific endopeptidase